MNVVVNGRATEVEINATVSGLVARLGRDPKGKGVAVAVNGEVLPRGSWDRTAIRPADRIEILDAIGGG